MPGPKYRIEWDAARRLMYSRLIGRWTVDITLKFKGDMLKTLRDAVERGPYKSLSNLTQFEMQSPEVFEILQDISNEVRAAGLEKVAHVITKTNTLVRMQADRSNKGIAVSIFATEREAYAWLMTPEQTSAAPEPQLNKWARK